MHPFDLNEISFDGYEVVKEEYLPPGPRPMMIVDSNGLFFNKEAVDALERTEYVHVLINIEDKQLIVVQSRKWDARKKTDRQRLRPSQWTLENNGGAAFEMHSNVFKAIIERIDYKPEYRYCVPGKKIVALNTAALSFDLTCFMAFVPGEQEGVADWNQLHC